MIMMNTPSSTKKKMAVQSTGLSQEVTALGLVELPPVGADAFQLQFPYRSKLEPSCEIGRP